MKSPFAALPSRTVTLKRETGEMVPDADGKPMPVVVEYTIDLRPWPIGYPEYLSTVFPAPVRFENGKPTEDTAKAQEHQAARVYILIAKCMGEQVDAKPPTSATDRGAWGAYAAAIRAEFEAACLVEGDISQLVAECYRLNQGAGRIPKA